MYHSHLTQVITQLTSSKSLSAELFAIVVDQWTDEGRVGGWTREEEGALYPTYKVLRRLQMTMSHFRIIRFSIRTQNLIIQYDANKQVNANRSTNLRSWRAVREQTTNMKTNVRGSTGPIFKGSLEQFKTI